MCSQGGTREPSMALLALGVASTDSDETVDELLLELSEELR